MVPVAEIDWIAADGDYVRLYVGNRQILVRGTMSAMEESLPSTQHVRIHRSAIVNVARVRTLKALPNTEYAVVLHNGATLRASRTYAERLRQALKLT